MQSIFVSSTFQDMHYERDIIQTKVVPAVNSVAEKFGESVAAFDLRWGINTLDLSEESSAKKVLDVCLDEIDRCRPYMIVILGYRYGWIPDRDMLNQAVVGRELSFDEEAISVTALEIEYGALSSAADLERTLFYFRDIDGPCESVYLPEDEAHRAKLEELKKRIQAMPGSHVRTYRMQYGEQLQESIHSFANMVAKDICALMRPEWEQNARLDAYDLDQIKQKHLLAEKEHQFIARTDLLNRSMEVFRTGKKMVLQGVTGSGKSTLTSKIGHQLQMDGHHVIPIYCGYTKLCSSGFDILRYVVWQLEKELGIEMHFCDVAGDQIGNPSAWYEYYDLLIKRCNDGATEKITFLIDGIDQLVQDDIAKEFTYLPGTEGDRIGFILSTTSRDRLPVGYPCVEVGRLSLEERKQVVLGILGVKHRELPKTVVEKMILPKAAALPLYLHLMVHRLQMMNVEDFAAISQLGNGMKAIEEYQIKLIDQCPSTLSDLALHVTTHATGLVGGSMMKEAIRLIAASRRGLRLSDLEGMLKPKQPDWNTVDAVAYFQYLGNLFIYRKDGRIDFAHKSIREGVVNQCNKAQRLALHAQLCDWLYRLPLNDEIRQQEVVWHMIRADRKRRFTEVTAEMSHYDLNISGMVKDIVDTVVFDDGHWLMEVIRECFCDNAFPTFTHMINYHLFFGLVNTARNLQTKLRITETMLEAVQKRCSMVKTHGTVWDVTIACDRLSAVHLAFGTKDHMDMALKCSEHSLSLREQLLEQYQQLDTVEKLREYFLSELQAISIQLAAAPTEDQLREMYRMICNETRRGICVVCEDIAGILNREEDREEQLLKYLLRSLELRLAMYRDSDGDSFVAGTSDEENEISRLYGMIAFAYMGHKDDGHWDLAEQSCAAALEFAEKALKKGETAARLEGWCAANIRFAQLYLMKTEPQYREKALACYMRCVPVLEKLNVRQRTVDSQGNLADLYNRLGNYYDQMDDEASAAAAAMYYQKSQKLILEMAQKCPSIQNLRSVVLVTQNQAQHMMNNRSHDNEDGSTQEQMEETLTLAFRNAQKLFSEVKTKASCEQLNDIYETVINLVAAGGLEERIEKRLTMELRVCQLENQLAVSDRTMDDLRSTIVRYAQLSSDLVNLEGSPEPGLSEAVKRLLEIIGFDFRTLTLPVGKRAYELMKVACQLSEQLLSKSEELPDLDIYAVTLSKYSGMCLMYSPQEWASVNEKVAKIALFLYRKTNREKYMQMLAMAELGKQMLSQSNGEAGSQKEASEEQKKPTHPVSRPVPNSKSKPDKATQIKKKIADLEEELKLIPGYTNILRKKKLEQQIAQLKQELQDLLS